MPKTMEIFWISRWSHFEEKIIFFKKITDYQQFSPVNDMLSTPIGKGYIILINDKSLWGKYVLRNADFRFSAQIRSHFLLHQEANHHRYSEGYPYFSPTSIGTLMMTSIGISHLFVDLRSTNHRGHFLWHPYFLCSFNRHTNNDILWDIPTFLSPTFRDTFRYT